MGGWVGGFTKDVVASQKSNIDFYCRTYLDGNHGQSVLKLECVPKFCYLDDTLGSGCGKGSESQSEMCLG